MRGKEFFNELKKRGLIYQATPNIEKFFEKKGTLYLGIDPTADGLHLGHYLGLTLLRRFYLNDFKIIIIVGGGTAKIGDPSGKEKERPILSLEVLEKNKQAIKKEIERFFPVDNKKVKIIDNSEWLDNLNLMEFLREIGKIITINSMLDLEAVRTRIQKKEGMSFAEFTYQLLQAYDFYILYEKYNCELQIGGSDQWGNIIQGVELIRKKINKEAYGLTYPLLVDPKTGKKFGKTEAGKTLWLNKEKTHPFEIYQFILNLPDELLEKVFYFYSFKKLEEIKEIINEWKKEKEKRLAQKELAKEIIELIHGKEIVDDVLKINQILFEKNLEEITLEEVELIKGAVPYLKTNRKELEEILKETELAKSKSEAKNLLKSGSVKTFQINNYLLIKKGKKYFGLVEFI
ncbi:MAG: tyrosine--tRNA ligase [Patescibacteria group bacterium]